MFSLLQMLLDRPAETAEYIDDDTIHETVNRCLSEVQ